MLIAYVCIGLLAILIFALGFAVSGARFKFRVGIGSPMDPQHPLHKLVRAHGNASEYNPVLMLLIFILAQQPLAGWATAAIIAVTASRYLHAAGMIFPKTMNRPNPLRFIGALGTYVFGIALVVEILRQAFAA